MYLSHTKVLPVIVLCQLPCKVVSKVAQKWKVKYSRIFNVILQAEDTTKKYERHSLTKKIQRIHKQRLIYRGCSAATMNL